MQSWLPNDPHKQVRALEELSRVRLSEHFFFRDFLFSEIAQVFDILNVPDDRELAIEAGSRLCSQLLEPLKATFGDVRIRSGFRSAELNALGHRLRLGCASNERNFAGHIWDRRDRAGRMGATATIVIPWLVDYCRNGGDWRSMAWFIHDHLPYSFLCFFPKLAAFNIQWREQPERRILSWCRPRGVLTEPGWSNHGGCHASDYLGYPDFDHQGQFPREPPSFSRARA